MSRFHTEKQRSSYFREILLTPRRHDDYDVVKSDLFNAKIIVSIKNTDLLLRESVFLNRSLYQEAERHYALRRNVQDVASAVQTEVNKVRDQIRSGLNDDTVKVADLVQRLSEVELENRTLRSALQSLENRLSQLEGGKPAATTTTAAVPAKPATAPAAAAPAKEDDFDLFDDDEDDAEAQRVKEERLKAYAEKKAKSKYSYD